jgi:signal transduction histidine kinase
MATAAPDERLRALIDAGTAIVGDLDLDEILQKVVRAACDLTGARYGALGVVDESGRRLSQFITCGIGDDERVAIGDLPRGRGILGVLITDARPLRLADLGSDPRSVGFPPNHPPMRTFLGVPVIAGRQVFGNLYLTEKEGGGEFTNDDEQATVMLAAQAGVAIHNARLFADAREHAEALERALGELSSVDDLLGALIAGRARDDVLDLLAQQAVRSVPCSVVGVALPDGDRTSLIYVSAAGATSGRLRGHAVPIASSKAGAALMARRAVRVDDLASDPDAYAPTAQVAGVKSLLISPLVRRYEAVGVIVAGGRDGGPFTDEDERVLAAYATRAVLVLELSQALSAERERAEAVAKLVASETREAGRRETLRRVVEAQEQERRRLAIELHDETGQSLASVLMGLRRVEESEDLDAVQATVAELRDTVANAVQELRALAVELRPKALDDFGLAPALERLVETFGRRTGLAVTTHLGGVDERLPEPVESAFYRIAQEGLTNIAKHAAASAASLVTRRGDASVVMVLEDDGQGFDADARSEGLGLVSMRERAELLGGCLTVESSTAGTTIVVEVPV